MSSRYILQGNYNDGNGTVVSSGTVTCYLAGTTTPATIYAASSGGSALSGGQTTSGIDGYFKFYIDDADYSSAQLFDVLLSKTGYSTVTYSNVPIVVLTTTSTSILTNKTLTAPVISSPVLSGSVTGTYTLSSPTITSPTITGTTSIGSGATITSPTVVTPTIASFANATHTHADAAGGGATLTGPSVSSPTLTGTVAGSATIGGTIVVPIGRLSASVANSGYPQSGTAGETLRILRGVVSSVGNILYGTGFTVDGGHATGAFVITFTTAFSNVPSVTASINNYSAGSIRVDPSAGSCTITTFDNANSATDEAFSFIACGPS